MDPNLKKQTEGPDDLTPTPQGVDDADHNRMRDIHDSDSVDDREDWEGK